MPANDLAPIEARNNRPINRRKRRRDDDLWGSVEFDRSYRADVAALMKHVKDVLAYLDTTELYVAGRTPDDSYFLELLARIETLQQATPTFRRVNYRGAIIGHRYLVNQPCRETLFLLDEMMLYPGISLHRYDFAYDFLTESAYRANALRLHLLRHLILRWCRSPYMPDLLGLVTYFAKYRNLPKRKKPVRNVIIYPDRPSKLTGDPCCHLDLRTVGATPIKAQGIEKASDLLDLDPAVLFERNLILVGDFWDQLEELCKHDSRLRHRTQDFRAQLLHKFCDDFQLNRISMGVLRLPTKLTI